MRDIPLDPAKLEAWALARGDLVSARPERTIIVRRVMQRLPRRQLEIINAVYFECLPLRQVALRFGVSHTTVRRHCLQFASRLEEALGEAL